MAARVIGPLLLVESALAAAPLPRPPHPIRATWTVLFPAAWTWGMATPAKAEAAAKRPVFFRNSRREVGELEISFIGVFHDVPQSVSIHEKGWGTARPHVVWNAKSGDEPSPPLLLTEQAPG